MQGGPTDITEQELQTRDPLRTFPVLDLSLLLRRTRDMRSSQLSRSEQQSVYRVVHRNIFLYKTNQIHKCIKFILFWSNTPHVSDGLSVHHQEFKTVCTATGICQTDTADCQLAGTRQQADSSTCLVAVCTVLNS